MLFNCVHGIPCSTQQLTFIVYALRCADGACACPAGLSRPGITSFRIKYYYHQVEIKLPAVPGQRLTDIET
jgi:hypothetical protein